MAQSVVIGPMLTVCQNFITISEYQLTQ